MNALQFICSPIEGYCCFQSVVVMEPAVDVLMWSFWVIIFFLTFLWMWELSVTKPNVGNGLTPA